ncbi:hypothetical protein H8S77_15190 [Parabacteroides sp. BX2]|uniref:Uncharacterized protein n=1 Tax=Parabacteroides segnis TaxID=2763058 RepID=A0ABR7E380_9BACT|nr:hypothetical protein [Parabacteroides segnis]MBC5644225.1 hypothetical protein [Parabacteroides segnis]
MVTISIDVKATNVQIDPAGVESVNLMADIDVHEIDNILDSIGQKAIAVYMRENGYYCEID